MTKSKKVKVKGKINKKKLIIISSVILAVILIIAILIILNNNGTFSLSKDKEDNVQEENKVPEIKDLQIVDINSDSRPYAIMINNINVARPYQSGLQDAYLIYEIIVEGGITRYMAVFKDQTTAKIGPVRSSRHYYLDYALENDAIYVHWGWSPQAQSDIKSLGINNINGLYDSGFWRDNSLNVATEHRGFTSLEKLANTAESKKYRTTTDEDLLLNYSVDKIDMASIDNATTAENISIKYSNSITTSYTYNADAGYYLRSVNNKPHVDYVTKEQYHFKNIIVYQVTNATIAGDEKNRQNLDNLGTGTGYYISDGISIPITWEKKTRSSQTKYYYENGEELKVNDGNTFIQIQPKGQSLEIL